LELQVLQARSEHDFDPTFAKLVELRARALVIAPDQLFTAHSKRLAELALQHALPAIYEFRQFVAAGGLISYGSSETEYYRLVGYYVGRVLKGDKPADLPVQREDRNGKSIEHCRLRRRLRRTAGRSSPLLAYLRQRFAYRCHRAW
jgi:putative ABC transport system substrate-binding protein